MSSSPVSKICARARAILTSVSEDGVEIDVREVTNSRATKKEIENIIKEFPNVRMEGFVVKRIENYSDSKKSISYADANRSAIYKPEGFASKAHISHADANRSAIYKPEGFASKAHISYADAYTKLQKKFEYDCLNSSTRHDFDWNRYSNMRAQAAMWTIYPEAAQAHSRS
jgi:23S rRNA-/tRNA-specific pseudouridylate synthase